MTLPKRPSLNQPIPNENIPNVPEQYTVKAPYWDAVIEGDLAVDAAGSLTLETGEGEGNPDTQVQAAWWGAPIGAGLTVNAAGELVPGVSPYCSPPTPISLSHTLPMGAILRLTRQG